jgi:hypothetical protein
MTVRQAAPLLLRVAAFALAVIGIIDPRMRLAERVPPAVELRVVPGGDTEVDAAMRAVVDGLQRALSGRVAFNSGARPAARVFAGDVSTVELSSAADVPVSTIALQTPPSPNVRISAADSPSPVPFGWAARFAATIDGAGMAGRTSTVVLEQNGVTLAQATHTWRTDRERTQVEMVYAAPRAGASRVALRVLPAEGEAVTSDNRADLRLTTVDRQLKVLVHEPRPSWAAAFVRRALEESAAFAVSSVTGASRGVAVRAGAPPHRLTAAALAPFDLVISGAPEELTRSDVDALRDFARVRGGAVIFVPDRRPSGPYLDVVPAGSFDEVLVDSPLQVRSAQAGSLRASVLVIPRDAARGRAIASIDQKAGEQPVILEWMSGAGRVIFAGALDAWRFRTSGGEGYAGFWESLAMAEALLSPRKIELSIHPAIARPGEAVTIRARLRRTELDENPSRTRTAPVTGRIIGGDGAATPIRLWPTAEAGAIEGRIAAPAEGRYDVQVASGQITADDVLITAADVRHAAGSAERQLDVAHAVAAATGGVAAAADDLSPLERMLTSLPSGEVTRTRHPARSPLSVAAFAVLLCAEWAIRRRRGLR